MLSEIQSNEPANELFFSIGDEPALSRDEAVALINLPDDRVDELLLRAGALRKKYKGDRVGIHLLTNVRSGNCSQNCAYCAQSCRSSADIETYRWVAEDKLYQDNSFVHDNHLSMHCMGLSGMKFSDEEIESKIDAMADDAMKSGNIAVNPRSSRKQDIVELYHKAL